MSMIVVVTENVPPRLRGRLAKPSFEAFRAWAIMCSPRQRG